MSKEIALFISLAIVIICGAIYWSWYQNRELNSLIKRIQDMPMVAAIIAIFWENNSDSNNDAQ
jgi:DNA-binding transcriptional regulator of glucitol operon